MRRLSRETGEAGEKFTRKVYITRILMLITGINTAQICFLHKQIFLQFRDHISQSSIHHRWYICLHRETVQLFNMFREKNKSPLGIKMLEVCCRVAAACGHGSEGWGGLTLHSNLEYFLCLVSLEYLSVIAGRLALFLYTKYSKNIYILQYWKSFFTIDIKAEEQFLNRFPT